MTWSGYLTFDGTEIANAARTEAYVGPSTDWFQRLHETGDLVEMLGHDPYVDPQTDEAPWYDPDVLASKDFWGFYPLDFVGFDASSRESAVTESASGGATPGLIRHGSKAVVCSGVLLGANSEAVSYGMTWLRRALVGGLDSDLLTTEQALGVTAGYLAAEPTVNIDDGDSAATTMNRLQRWAHKAVVNNGPTPLFVGNLSCGAAVTTVTFTLVAGSPFEFGNERAILQDWLSASDPWVPGVPNGTITGPASYDDVVCGQDQYQPIFDPECPALIVPPPPPLVPLGCFEVPETWSRRTVTIPASVIPLWEDVTPKITVYAPSELRGARVRFYEDADGDGDPNDDPCAFLGDFVISYIPAGGTLILDAGLEEVHVVTSQGHKRRADSLVFRTDGTPFDWPSLSNGYGYIMVLDIVPGEPTPVVDLSLTPRAV